MSACKHVNENGQKQTKIIFKKTNMAIKRGKRNEGLSPDETSNEHLWMLDQESRGNVHETSRKYCTRHRTNTS